MMEKFKKYSIMVGCLLTIGIILFLLMNFLSIDLTNIKNISILILTSLVIYGMFDNHLFRYQIVNILIYIILLILILFIRPKYDKMIFADGQYIISWLKIVFKNKIVFLNLFVNFLLFVPLGIIFKRQKFKHIYLGLILIVIIELIQAILRVGIFDIIDIILNFSGFITGYLVFKKR